MKLVEVPLVVLVSLLFADALQPPKYHGYCEVCDLVFDKLVDHQRHLQGRRHADALSTFLPPQELWPLYQKYAPQWAATSAEEEIAMPWSMEELSSLQLKYRTYCLHPKLTLGKLTSYQKARLWRYLYDSLSIHYIELTGVIAAIASTSHMRVKELFESIEVYRKLCQFIIEARNSRRLYKLSEPTQLLDVACGHAFVSMLLAYRFANLQIHAFDLHQRQSFVGYCQAFEDFGIRQPNASAVLPNLHFHEMDFFQSAYVVGDERSTLSESIITVIHGCGEINERVLQIAKTHSALGYAVLPCCIKKKMYLDPACSVQLTDDVHRHVLLCGALAREYDAQLVCSIDNRITNRAIFIAGGVQTNGGWDPNGDIGVGVERATDLEGMLPLPISRRSLPRLNQS